MFTSSQLYFGSEPCCLDIFTLRYRWFGAIWKYEGNHQTVLGFWFGDNKRDVVEQAHDAGWISFVDSNDPEATRSVYEHIRNRQREHDWGQRSRLALYTAFIKPWKDVPPGWYVIRSDRRFPFYVAAIRKTKFFVWLEHASVCETQRDVDIFLERVNREHGVKLQVVSRNMMISCLRSQGKSSSAGDGQCRRRTRRNDA